MKNKMSMMVEYSHKNIETEPGTGMYYKSISDYHHLHLVSETTKEREDLTDDLV